MNQGYTRITQNRRRRAQWVFLEMCRPDLLTGCWIWEGAFQGRYGVYNEPGERTHSAHRYSYQLLIGPIPDGKQLDHLCRNPACVNPDHLQPVTARENVLRAVTARATINAAKSVCDKGHNDWYLWRGHRQCRACKLNHQRRTRKERT